MTSGALEATPPQPVTRRLGRSLSLRAATAAMTVTLLLALPALAKAFHVVFVLGLATQVLIYAIAAMSLNLVLGYGGMVTFGQAAFFGLGGYTVGILHQNFSEAGAFLGLVPGSDCL